MSSIITSFIENIFQLAAMTTLQALTGLVLMFMIEFSFFLTFITTIPYLPFILHFLIAAQFTVLYFYADETSFPSLLFLGVVYIFVFFRIFSLFINDTQVTQMSLSSLFYPQTGTILTPLALDFIQQQAKTQASPSTQPFSPRSPFDTNMDDYNNNNNNNNTNNNDHQAPKYALSTISDQPTKIPILFVIAHPDDESMFFTPLLHVMSTHNKFVLEQYPTLSTTPQDKKNTQNDHPQSFSFQQVTPAIYDIHILCLTTGNAAGLGATRTTELINTCTQIHNIPAANIELVNDEANLPDSMTLPWNQSIIEGKIEDYISRKKLSTIDFSPSKVHSNLTTSLHHLKFHDLVLISFDPSGVSGHLNHIACYNATRAVVNRYNIQLLLEEGSLQNTLDLQNGIDNGQDHSSANNNIKKNGNNPVANFDFDQNNSSDDENNENYDELTGERGQLMHNRKKLVPTDQLSSNKEKQLPLNKITSKHLAYRTQLPITRRYISMYGVETIPLWAKYLGPYGPILILTAQLNAMDKPPTDPSLAVENKLYIPNTLSLQSWNAMAMHYSQWVWFRKLFVIFSTYSYVTPLVLIEPSPIHPSMKQIGKTIRTGLVMD